MTHYKERYEALLPIHQSTVKQYEVLVKKNDDIITLSRRYSDQMEEKIKTLENENLLLKERIKALESTASN